MSPTLSVPGDLEQPSYERRTTPLEAAEVGERLVENLGGQVLGLAAAGGAADDEGVHAIEVVLVERAEALRVRLGGLDQEALVIAARGDLRR